MYDFIIKVGLLRKLIIRWKGLYIVIEKCNDINYVINIDGKMLLVNKYWLRLFNINNDDIIIYNDE